MDHQMECTSSILLREYGQVPTKTVKRVYILISSQIMFDKIKASMRNFTESCSKLEVRQKTLKKIMAEITFCQTPVQFPMTLL